MHDGRRLINGVLSGSTFIDLTEDDTRAAPPGTVPTQADSRPSPAKSDPFNDPTLGNPYDQNTKFYF